MLPSLSHLCACRMGNICKEGRIDVWKLLHNWTLPDDVAHHILMRLPLNQLITLDDEGLGYVDAFNKTWQTLCAKCAARSTAFRTKLTHALEAEREVDDPESSAKVVIPQVASKKESYDESDLQVDQRREKNIRRNVLLNGLFQELIDICMHKNSRHTRGRPVYLLSEALVLHGHNIPDEEMFRILSRHVTKCNIYSRQITFLQTSMDKTDDFFKKLEEVAFVITDATSKDKWADFFMVLQKNIHIDTLSLCGCNSSETIIDLLATRNPPCYDSLPPKRPKLSSLWDEAVADVAFNTEPPDSDNENDIYAGMLPPSTILKSNTFSSHIANLHIDLSHEGDALQWQRFSAALASWTSLQSIRVVFPKQILTKQSQDTADQQKHCDHFAYGISKLCSDGGTRLRSVSVAYGTWRCKSIRTLGYALCRKHVPCKYVDFDGCAILPPEGVFLEAPYDTRVTTLRMHEVVFADNKTCLQMLPLFLKVFNPIHLVFTSVKGSWSSIDPMLEQLSQIWKGEQLSKCRVSSIVTEIEPHLNSHSVESMLEKWLSVKLQYFKGIDFTIYHYTNISTILHECLTGNRVTFVRLKNCPESRASVADYVAVM